MIRTVTINVIDCQKLKPILAAARTATAQLLKNTELLSGGIPPIAQSVCHLVNEAFLPSPFVVAVIAHTPEAAILLATTLLAPPPALLGLRNS
jgi:hypothetical protein